MKPSPIFPSSALGLPAVPSMFTYSPLFDQLRVSRSPGRSWMFTL